jgi:hypothetical protein
MDNFLKINDLITFNYLNTELIHINDDFKNARGPFKPITDQTDISKLDAKGLKVKIAATHSGIITRNNMFYLPDKMKKAAPTFLEDYGKPVLKHHNERQDSIGRVIDSVYLDTSGVIKDSFSTLFDSSKLFNEVSLRDFCDGRMPFGLQVDFARNHLINDRSLESSVYVGLGHIQIVADITDPDAIQKFLDGRFLTGSVGARTNSAVCSVCKQDYTKDGSCEHVPGAIYDGKKCVLITGDFFYDEYSVVNSPADRQSRVLELYYNGNVNNIEVKNEFAGNVYEVRLDFPQYEKKEERMADRAKDKKEETKIEDAVKTEEQTIGKEEETETQKVEDSQKTELSIEDMLILAVEKEDELTDEVVDKLYDAMFDGFEDAKLSTEKRKKLSKSTFCGPNRSFPVPDCAHVTAARRLIGKYKGSGDKSKIIACVDRKAKAMGCDKKTKDAISHARVLQMLTQTMAEHMYEKKSREEDGEAPVLSDEDVTALTSVMKNLVSMVGKDNFVAVLSSGEKGLKDVVKHFQDIDLLQEIISLETKMGELRGEMIETETERDALKDEYDILQKENEGIRDELISEKQKVRDYRVDKLSILTSLKDGEVKEEQKTEWLSLSDEVLESSLNNLNKEIDIVKLSDKLNDGTSRKPQGEVGDPTLGFEDMTEDMEKKIADIENKAMRSFADWRQAQAWRNAQIELLISKERTAKEE